MSSVKSKAKVKVKSRRPASLPVKFGIEFEFAARDNKRVAQSLQSNSIPYLPESSRYCPAGIWSLGRDSSVVTSDRMLLRRYRGIELRTPTSNSSDDVIVSQIQRALKGCRDAGGTVTMTSGMHVHLSCPTRGVKVDVVKLSAMVEKEFRSDVRPIRSRYCEPGWSENSKYYAVRVVDGNHIEVRVFNGTLDSRKALRRLRQVVSMYRECLYRDINRFEESW